MSDLHLVGRLLGLLRPQWPTAVGMLAAGTLAVWLSTTIPLITQSVIDSAVLAHDRSTIPRLAMALLTLSVLRWVCQAGRRLLTGRLAMWVQTELRNRLTARFLATELDWHQRSQVGRLLSTCGQDVHAVRKLLSFGVTFVVIDTATVVLVCVRLALLSPAFTIVSLGLLPTLTATTLLRIRQAAPIADEVQRLTAEATSVAEQNAANVHVVRAFGAERAEIATMRRVADSMVVAARRLARLGVRYTPMALGAVQVGVVAILWLGGRMVISGQLELGTVVAAAGFLTMLTWPIQSLVGLLDTVQQGFAGARRIFAVLEREPEIADAPDAVDLTEGLTGARLTLDDVDLGNDRRLSMEIAAAEHVALTGRSGTGKSTVAALTARFCDPVNGRVLLDGHDLGALTLASVRRAVMVVPSDPVFLSGSVRYNLVAGHPHATDREITTALCVAGASDAVDWLPAGLDAELDAHASTLSGGQRQRLAIAMALLARPRVLVLDDAMTQLDIATECLIIERLGEALPDVTVLIIAARSGTLATRTVSLDDAPVNPTMHAGAAI